MSTMIERMARAMCEKDGFAWDAENVSQTVNGESPEEQRGYWLEKARSALEAMKEPTKVMIEPGYKAIDDAVDEYSYDSDWGYTVDSLGPASVWRAMITAALEEGE